MGNVRVDFYFYSGGSGGFYSAFVTVILYWQAVNKEKCDYFLLFPASSCISSDLHSTKLEQLSSAER